jgi:G6PDH family F420-dependent oxidoreductase
VRVHPAVLAQAAATSAVMLEGRFAFGIGSGEALNEHILGTHWPEADVRLEMLEEAVEVMRGLWRGKQFSHRGRHYTVENARIYTLPDEPPPVLVSGFGPKSVDLAGRIGDGYVTTMPDPDLLARFREAGGAGKIAQGGTKVCWGPDEDECVKTVHKLWPNEGLSGELAQVLPTPAHFDQATELVTEEMIAASVPCGPDTARIVAAMKEFEEAGYDELYVAQIGPRQSAFFEVLEREILPEFG